MACVEKKYKESRKKPWFDPKAVAGIVKQGKDGRKYKSIENNGRFTWLMDKSDQPS